MGLPLPQLSKTSNLEPQQNKNTHLTQLPCEFGCLIATTRLVELAGLLVGLYKDCDPKEEDLDALSDFMVATVTLLDAMPEDEPIYCESYFKIIGDLSSQR